MSVAFRREGDDEHLEPKFEIPIPTGPNLVTARGLALINHKIGELKLALLQAGVDQERTKSLQREMRYWQTRQITAEVRPLDSTSVVAIGTQVIFQSGAKRRTLAITGYDEADPAQSRISFASPLARALLGSRVGDEIDFGNETLEILAIKPDISTETEFG